MNSVALLLRTVRKFAMITICFWLHAAPRLSIERNESESNNDGVAREMDNIYWIVMHAGKLLTPLGAN